MKNILAYALLAVLIAAGVYGNRQLTPLICFWAFDHFILMSWPIPLPVAVGTANIVQN